MAFTLSCAITNQVINPDEEVVVFLLNARTNYDGYNHYAWNMYSPIALMLEGKYDGGGGIEDGKIFISENVYSEEELNQLSTIVLEDLQNKVSVDPNKGMFCRVEDNLTEFSHFVVNKERFFTKHNKDIARLKKNLEEYKTANEKDRKFILRCSGFDDINSLENYLSLQQEYESIPIEYMFVKKEKLQQIYKSFAKEKTPYNPACKTQELRSKIELRFTTLLLDEYEQLDSLVDFVNGTNIYAGGNTPLYTLYNLLDQEDKKLSSLFKTFYYQQSLDVMLLNDYYMLLGKTWNKSMTMSEFVENEGHKEAYKLLKKLMK